MNANMIPLISADSHVEEPPGLYFDELSDKAREFLPPELKPTDSASQFKLRIGAAEKQGELTAEELEGERHRQEIASIGTTNLEGRMKVMESEGVVGECIYPTKSLYLWNMDDEETGITCARIYNDWIYDLLESRSERFRCAAVIPTWSIEAAMAEVERTAAKGLAAMMLPLVGTPEFNHDRWKPLWSLIEETGCPVVMHQGSGHDMLFYRGPGASVSNLLATQSMAPRTAGLLTMAGVLENHPDLHFVFVETNAAWISWAMGTLDHYDEAFRKNVNWVRPALKEKPSFYIKRQIHGSFQRDETAVRNIPITGPQVALWGSDWPHEEGTYPNSQAVVAEMADMVSKEDLDAMVFGVAADLFKFDKEKLLEPF